MPRESIAMSHDELLAFVGEERRCILGTLDADGRPWPDAVACLLRGDLLYIRVPADSRSHRNIQRDTRVCAVFERFPTYHEIKGATVHGRAASVSGGHALDALPD
ncbi:MAG: pyridoxamine 5'-phosphate oxidase family protein, partial [Chloroflexi bacterium]|nr:pyridoxamine 5'-phosphate oxidase family protein [Chloroflexota bacterium]